MKTVAVSTKQYYNIMGSSGFGKVFCLRDKGMTENEAAAYRNISRVGK